MKNFRKRFKFRFQKIRLLSLTTLIAEKKTENRKIRPYQLVLENDVCYLFGFDEMRNADRIFSLSRIKNAEIIEETFTLPEDFEFDSTQALKIKDWVLSAGCNARPFEPQWLADEWKRNAQEMSKMAEK